MSNENWYAPEDVPPGTPQELLDTLNYELKAMRQLWLLFNKYNTDTDTGSTILPTSLSGFAFDMVHENYHSVVDETCTPDDTSMLSGWAAFGAVFFKFGQFCYRHGFLDSNLTEILDAERPSVDPLSDEALRKFMSNG